MGKKKKTSAPKKDVSKCEDCGTTPNFYGEDGEVLCGECYCKRVESGAM